VKIVDGMINGKNPKPPNPKPSPKDFVWPPQDHDDKVAQKFAASLQELLPARDWKHIDLARALWGTMGPNDTPRNVAPARRWVLAEHPIPNEETAGYVAEVLGVSMARLLEPEGKFNPLPDMIRPRSDSPRFGGKAAKKAKKAKKAAVAKVVKTAKAKTDMRGKWKRPKAAKVAKVEKRKYTRRVPLTTSGNGGASPEGGSSAWVLHDGMPIPEYSISSHEDFPDHLKVVVNAVIPQDRAMAILNILEHRLADEE
jgi:hypothetical protein